MSSIVFCVDGVVLVRDGVDVRSIGMGEYNIPIYFILYKISLLNIVYGLGSWEHWNQFNQLLILV